MVLLSLSHCCTALHCAGIEALTALGHGEVTYTSAHDQC